MVIDFSASSRVIRCSGIHPAAGQFSASCRDTALWGLMAFGET